MKTPLITMSAITGKPSKKEIHKYLKGLKENGVEQAMLYPRSGCEIDYLSEKWFETIGNFVSSASDLNMCLWLYDEFNWPSGDAGGRVTAIDSFRLKAIETKGENAGKISYKSRHNAGLFGEKYFPDLLSEEAVDFFISLTHEEYFKRFGKYFGSVIKGIFTDEPSIGYCCEGSSVAYYDGMEKDYYETFKRDFVADMATESKSFFENATTLISNRFKRCYISKVANWCESHGILMVGHLMCDDDPAGAVRHGGDFLNNLSSLSLPGVDEIWSDLKSRNEMALLGSIEYASGKNGAMAELFALGPCSMNYAKKRLMIYLCAAFKVDHYFLAVSHMDMRGNKLIRDYFNAYSTDQPDFGGMRLLATEAQIAYELAQKDFVPDVYVRYPYTQCAQNVTGWFDTSTFHNLLNELTYNQIQWKLINHEKVEKIPVIELNEKGEVFVGNEPFDISKINHKKTVVDANNDTPQGIFVRNYKDGSFIALNLFAPAGTYFINGVPVYFDECGIVTSNQREEIKKEEISTSFDVEYENYNVIRTMHLKDEATSQIQCTNDMDVLFAVRSDVCAYLDGKKIQCENECCCLSDGMKAFYKMSQPVSLKQGDVTVTADNDFKYLPSLFVVGDFFAEVKEKDVKLKERKRKYQPGEQIFDYGIVNFTSKVHVPNGIKAIELLGTNLYTRVYLNGCLIGENIVSPYRFDIPSDFCGNVVELKIVQYTSIAPIFGNVKYWDDFSENVGWRGTPSTEKTPFGFEKAFWIKDGEY